MNRTLLIILIFISSLTVAQAQDFSVSKTNVTFFGDPTDFEFYDILTINNNTGGTLHLKWEVQNQSLPTGWDRGLCDNKNCYTNVDTGTYSPVSDATTTLKMIFYPGGKSGAGQITVLLYEPGDKANGITVTFNGKAGVTGIKESNQLKFNFYPSPARNVLNLQFTKKGNHKVEIYNVLGKKLIEESFFATDKGKINLDKIPSGMYVISYKNSRGEVFTRTFSKE